MADEGDASPGINVNGGQGVQIGSGSVQYNTCNAKSALDPASLSRLAPHTALTRLQAMQHDDIVDLFASASPGDAADVLQAFLTANEAEAIAVLADINSRKAAALIEPFTSSDPWLKTLPYANNEITGKATALRWAYEEKSGPLERYPDGYVRRYGRGQIYWNSRAKGLITVRLQMSKMLPEKGYYPAGNETSKISSVFGASGCHQSFRHDSFVMRALRHFKFYKETDTGDLAVYATDKYGMNVVHGEIWAKYHAMGAETSWLGFPLKAGAPALSDHIYQRFEGGGIYWSSQNGGIAVPNELNELVPREIGLPASEEMPIGAHPDDRIQFFDKAVATLRDGKREIWFRP